MEPALMVSVSVPASSCFHPSLLLRRRQTTRIYSLCKCHLHAKHRSSFVYPVRSKWKLPVCLEEPIRYRKTSLSCSVAEAEAALTELENEQIPKTRLIAQNIPWDSQVDEIRALFEKHGTVVDIEFSMYNKRKNRGLAFITMSSEEEAQTTINNLNKTELGGRKIIVEFARSQKKQPSVPQEGSKFKYSVYVGNFPFNAKSQDLREFFQKDGSVVSAQIIYNSRPRRSAGYGFISYYSKEEAEVAIKTFDGKEFMGRPLKMGYAKEISTEEKTDGDSTESKTDNSQENTENITSVTEEKTVNV